MKCLLDSMLALTKQDRLCHIIHATSDPFYYTWLRQLNVIQHCKVGLPIRMPLNIENICRSSRSATVLRQRCARSFSSVFCPASQSRSNLLCLSNCSMKRLGESWPIGKIILTTMVRDLVFLSIAYDNPHFGSVSAGGNFDSTLP